MKKEFEIRAKKFWNNMQYVKTPPNENFDLQQQLDIHKKLFSIFQVGQYYLLVFNHAEIKFDYCSDDIEQVLGYRADEYNLDLFLGDIPALWVGNNVPVTFFQLGNTHASGRHVS